MTTKILATPLYLFYDFLTDMLLANWNQVDKGNHRFIRQALDPAAEEYRTVIYNITSAGGKSWAKRVKQVRDRVF